MKRIFSILCVLALVVVSNKTMAQEDKTSYDKSRKLSEQLKNGTAPGLKFAPVSQKATVSKLKEPTAAEKSVPFSKRLKEGSVDGTPIAKGGGAISRPVNANAKHSATVKLPSEIAAGADKTLESDKKAFDNSQAPNLDQGGVKEETHAPVAKPAIKPAVKPAVKAADKTRKPAAKQ